MLPCVEAEDFFGDDAKATCDQWDLRVGMRVVEFVDKCSAIREWAASEHGQQIMGMEAFLLAAIMESCEG